MNRSGNSQQGFTLLEIMVAMVILTLIMTASFGALRLGERSWEIGISHSAKTETLRSVGNVLQRLMSQALPMQWQQNAKKTLAFRGAREQLRFIGPAPAHHGATGLFEYSLGLKPSRDSAQLYLRYRLHNPDQAEFSAEDSDHHEVILVDNLQSLDFSFFGAPDGIDDPDWFDHWSDESKAYPELVRLRLVTHSEAQQWPELYLPLRLRLEPRS